MEYIQKMERYCKPCNRDTPHLFSGVQPILDELIEYSDSPQIIRSFKINYDCMACKNRTFDVDRTRVTVSKLEAKLIASHEPETQRVGAAGDKVGNP